MNVVPLSLLLAACAASTALAQDSVSTRVDTAPTPIVKPYRSPRLAQALGFVPGWGYMYSGEYWRGYLTWVGTIGGVGLGPVIFQLNSCVFALFSGCKPGPTWPYKLWGTYLTGMGLWIWYSSARDAPHAAQRANERHERDKLRITPVLDHAGVTGSEWRSGLSVSW